MWWDWLVKVVSRRITSERLEVICRNHDGREWPPFSVEVEGRKIILCEHEEPVKS